MLAKALDDLIFAAAVSRRRYNHPLSLVPYHSRVYSIDGEDGIIAEIFRRITPGDRLFIEIGTESGVENNTRLLLEQGWRGVWVNSNFGAGRDIFAEFIKAGQLVLIEAFVTAENINALLDDRGVPAAVDFLSLDIDQNTSHVWRALNRRSRAACIEYNGSLPASVALEVPYDSQGAWDGTNWFGASLKALEHIAHAKGMSLVGCELSGSNAFFVAAREARRRFQKPFTAEVHWEPARYNYVLSRVGGHAPSQTARRWVVPKRGVSRDCSAGECASQKRLETTPKTTELSIREAEMQDNVWDTNYRAGWGSGAGSLLSSTVTYRFIIESFIRLNEVRSVLDVGCGDWQFSNLIPWDEYGISYLGLDLSSVIVEKNTAAFGTERRRFRVIREPSEIFTHGPFDLVICKDVLQHTSNNIAVEYLDAFIAVGRRSLVTNDVFPSDRINEDIDNGSYRAIDLRKPPFSRNSSIIAEYVNFSGNDCYVKHVHLLIGQPS